MRQKRRPAHPGGPRMRPYDPDDIGRIEAGSLRGMQLAGYDYPVRMLRRSGDKNCVTLPLQVRRSLDAKRGDWLVFGETPWRGVAAFVKVSAEQYERIAPDGRKGFQRLARKIQSSKGTLSVTVPCVICCLLSADTGDFLIFGLTPLPGVISVAVVKGGGESTGSRRSG